MYLDRGGLARRGPERRGARRSARGQGKRRPKRDYGIFCLVHKNHLGIILPEANVFIAVIADTVSELRLAFIFKIRGYEFCVNQAKFIAARTRHRS
jgi:hypothetical protein